MTDEFARAGFVQKCRAELLAVFRAEFENVADLNRAPDFQWFAALGAGFAGGNRPQIKPFRHLDVALHGNIVQMEPVLVGAGGHVVRAAQPFVGENFRNASLLLYRVTCHRLASNTAPRLPGCAPSSGNNFFRRGRTNRTVVRCCREFGFIQLVVAANQNNDRLAVGDVNQRLDLAIGRNVVRRFAQCLNGHNAGRGKFFNGRADFTRGGFGNAAGGFLNVRRITAGLAEHDLVLAGLGRHHEFVRKFAADDAGVGLDRKRLQPAPRKNARVGVVHFLVTRRRAPRRSRRSCRRPS